MTMLFNILNAKIFYAVLALTITSACSYLYGVRTQIEKQKNIDLERMAANAIEMNRKYEVSNAIDTEFIKKSINATNKTKRIANEVRTYVSKEADVSCVIPSVAVRLHDDAASFSIP